MVWYDMISHDIIWCGIISYHLFADADTGIYPHAPNAKRGIAVPSVDKFPQGLYAEASKG